MNSINELLLAAVRNDFKERYSFGADTPAQGAWGLKVISFGGIEGDWDRVIWHDEGTVYVVDYFGDLLRILIADKNRKRKARKARKGT